MKSFGWNEDFALFYQDVAHFLAARVITHGDCMYYWEVAVEGGRRHDLHNVVEEVAGGCRLFSGFFCQELSVKRGQELSRQ